MSQDSRAPRLGGPGPNKRRNFPEKTQTLQSWRAWGKTRSWTAVHQSWPNWPPARRASETHPVSAQPQSLSVFQNRSSGELRVWSDWLCQQLEPARRRPPNRPPEPVVNSRIVVVVLSYLEPAWEQLAHWRLAWEQLAALAAWPPRVA
jgi:hypothetical protein